MRYLLNLSYAGNFFHGYNKQKGKKTVQGSLEDALSNRFDKEIKVTGCSRTDALVHALDFYAHFDAPEKVDISKLQKYLNDYLNGEIYIKSIKEVDNDFHARFDVKNKTYMYIINMGEYNPIEKDTVLQYNKKIDIKKIKKACKDIVGKHDFKAFTPADNIKESYVRNIESIKIVKNNNYLVFFITGDGFLRYMIRNIIGLLLDINEDKKKVSDVKPIIESKDRSKNGMTISASGLYLYRVKYAKKV